MSRTTSLVWNVYIINIWPPFSRRPQGTSLGFEVDAGLLDDIGCLIQSIRLLDLLKTRTLIRLELMAHLLSHMHGNKILLCTKVNKMVLLPSFSHPKLLLQRFLALHAAVGLLWHFPLSHTPKGDLVITGNEISLRREVPDVWAWHGTINTMPSLYNGMAQVL